MQRQYSVRTIQFWLLLLFSVVTITVKPLPAWSANGGVFRLYADIQVTEKQGILEKYGFIGVAQAPGDQGPLGNRQPLILIHGWSSKSSKWDSFAKYFYECGLSSKYKLYRVSYDWSQHIAKNSESLYQAIHKNVEQKGQDSWAGHKIFIIGHSTGGLVARSAIKNHPDLASQLGLLIMLGTPNHGSPLANLAWFQNHSFEALGDPATKLISEVLHLNCDGGWDLGWDNYDDHMPDDVLDGNPNKKVPRADGFTMWLNKDISNEPVERYIAIGSHVTPAYAGEILGKNLGTAAVDLSALSGNEAAKLTATVLRKFSVKLDVVQAGESLTYALLACTLRDNTAHITHNYDQNDGIVPLQSALFLNKDSDSWAGQKYEFKNIFHTNLPENIKVQEKIKDYLSNWIDPSKIQPSSPNYTLPPTQKYAAPAPVIVIDRSGSLEDVTGVMAQVEYRAAEVVNAIKNTVGGAAVINFSGTGNTYIDASFTNNANNLLRAIQHPSVSGGGTAIYDAVESATQLAQGKHTMLILLTDGENNEGRAKINDAVRFCQERNVPMVIIGFVGSDGRNEAQLSQMANATGGFYVKNENANIQDILQRFYQYSQYKSKTRPREMPN